MPTITYRALDPYGDPLFGNGQGNFLSDVDAVAQAIGTRIKLLQLEWWESVNDGTPLFQSILGSTSPAQQAQTIALILEQRILNTPYVLSISDVQTSFDPIERIFGFTCRVQTQFGTVTVTTTPTPQNYPKPHTSL